MLTYYPFCIASIFKTIHLSTYITPKTPHRGTKACEYDTIRGTRFFEAFDTKNPSKTLQNIADLHQIHKSTASKWLAQRERLGSPAYRRTRKLSHRLGRQPEASEMQARQLVSAPRSLRLQSYEAQIDSIGLDCRPRTLQLALTRHTKHRRRYKMQKVKKVKDEHKRKRHLYGKEHKDKSMGFWEDIHFTDEFHIDPGEVCDQWILREQGTREDSPNIQERPLLEGVKLHAAGWINWWRKAEKLEFYNDEHEVAPYTEKPKRPSKPRRSRYETDEEYKARVQEWEAEKPHEVEVKPKGNSMTQAYYTERILPICVNAVQASRIQRGRGILQEDGDPSHGNRSYNNVAVQYRRANWIETLNHPPYSPDLNPIEGIWSILKQRVRRRQKDWRTLEESKGGFAG